MSFSAIVLMVVAMLILWGGLVLAIVNLLVSHPERRQQSPYGQSPYGPPPTDQPGARR